MDPRYQPAMIKRSKMDAPPANGCRGKLNNCGYEHWCSIGVDAFSMLSDSVRQPYAQGFTPDSMDIKLAAK
jgi:hypothetical protein